jgi:hypothetical protein
MDFTIFYNHASMMQSVSEGEKIINNTTGGTGAQVFNIGDIVRPTDLCPHNFGAGVVTSTYMQNGYVYYEVMHKVGKRQTTNNYRQKDLRK